MCRWLSCEQPKPVCSSLLTLRAGQGGMRGQESAQSQDKGSAITGLWPGSTPYIFFLQFLCDFFQVNMINSENSAGITHSLRAFVITYPSIPFLYLLLLLCFNFSSSIFFLFCFLSIVFPSFFFLSFLVLSPQPTLLRRTFAVCMFSLYPSPCCHLRNQLSPTPTPIIGVRLTSLSPLPDDLT